MPEETRPGVLAILGYHKIGPPPPSGWETWNYVPEETFADHLRLLREAGWQILDLATFLRGLAAPQTLPARAALLTFDDGYRSNLTVAVPWLRRFGVPAVIFVPTDFIGGRNTFDAGVEPEEEICSWADLRELEAAGVAAQSHGCSHRALSGLGPLEWEREIVHARAVLEEGLGRPVKVFCYAYGDGGRDPEEVRRVLRQAGYRAACLYGGGVSFMPPADVYRLPRLAMGPDTDLRAALAVLSAEGEV
jgi:peptidoglycan/xylan/chitin deacetylase (PgdA/CDA1 family)